jgi:murein DD-endopeptidase MepM/ murein hydrolase activator NlpD
MKNNLFLKICLLVLLSKFSYCQTVNVFTENQGKTFLLFATNEEFYPVSLKLDLNLSNMVFSKGDSNIFLIPPKSIKFKIGDITAEGNKKYKFSYKFRTAMGDVNQKNYDKNYIYDLPFLKNRKYKLFQGYNGDFSHKNENALDFTMPEGSEVTAAREGIVVKVIQNNNENCLKPECKKFNNYITIMHPDFTFANYDHIKFNGAKCKIGDVIKKGDLIAFSGNVGYSSGPHLHFVCYLGGFDNWVTLPTFFKVNATAKGELLKEGVEYFKNY